MSHGPAVLGAERFPFTFDKEKSQPEPVTGAHTGRLARAQQRKIHRAAVASPHLPAGHGAQGKQPTSGPAGAAGLPTAPHRVGPTVQGLPAIAFLKDLFDNHSTDGMRLVVVHGGPAGFAKIAALDRCRVEPGFDAGSNMVSSADLILWNVNHCTPTAVRCGGSYHSPIAPPLP